MTLWSNDLDEGYKVKGQGHQIMWFWHYLNSFMCVWISTNQPTNQPINQSIMIMINQPIMIMINQSIMFPSHVFNIGFKISFVSFSLFQLTLSNVFNQPTNQSTNQCMFPFHVLKTGSKMFFFACLNWAYPTCLTSQRV